MEVVGSISRDDVVQVSFSQTFPIRSGVDVYNMSFKAPGNSFSIIKLGIVVHVIGCDLDVLLKDQGTGSFSPLCTVTCPNKTVAEMEYMKDCNNASRFCCGVFSPTPAQALEFQFVPHKRGVTEKVSNLSILWDRINVTVIVPLVWSIADHTRCPKDEEEDRRSTACASEHSHCESSVLRDAGYACRCDKGYKGNPYILDGCTNDEGDFI